SVILSFAALKIGNPLSVIFPMALFAVFAGGFISALKSANDYKEQPIRAGIYTCLGNLIIIVIVALISSTFSGGFREAFFPPAVLIVSSALGILAGTRIKPSTKRRLKKLRRQVR
ncbi:MAG TPA: hypothetical protein DD733_09200, partial [Clostridiales bacterium]|nr:hypothetical protein [Clostridiales bacterium]